MDRDYFQTLQDLLPPGPAFSAERHSSITDFLKALANPLSRADSTSTDLLSELDPATSVELLDVWETYLGLPDAPKENDNLQQRQSAVLAKLTATGAPQIRSYLRLIPENKMRIKELSETCVGSVNAGDLVYNEDYQWVWIALVPNSYKNTNVAIELNRRLQAEAPSYTRVVLAYGHDFSSYAEIYTN